MPRRRTTTDTLEHQAAKDSDLETTPFDGYEMPSREATLKDLDARGDALNGHDALKASGAITLPPGAPLPEEVLRRQRDRDDVVLMADHTAIEWADALAEAANGVLNCMARGQTALDDRVMAHDNGCLLELAAAITRYTDARREGNA